MIRKILKFLHSALVWWCTWEKHCSQAPDSEALATLMLTSVHFMAIDKCRHCPLKKSPLWEKRTEIFTNERYD